VKTATVRDLRNRYTSLLAWLEAGEEIVITQRGKAVARLVPEPGESSGQVDWSRSPALKRDRSDTRFLSAGEASELLHDASGQW
jgi:prevent-host-death family protein